MSRGAPGTNLSLCDRCASWGYENEEKLRQEMASLRDNFPKTESWCDVSFLHTEWRCPNGCLNCEDENEPEICDWGRVKIGEPLEFTCYQCGYSRDYKINIQLVGGIENG